MKLYDLKLDPKFDLEDYIYRIKKDLKLYKEECSRLSELAYQRQQRNNKAIKYIRDNSRIISLGNGEYELDLYLKEKDLKELLNILESRNNNETK